MVNEESFLKNTQSGKKLISATKWMTNYRNSLEERGLNPMDDKKYIEGLKRFDELDEMITNKFKEIKDKK